MAIGEFGGAPAAAGDTGPMYAAPAYWLYEMGHASLNPSRAFADAARLFFKNPANPLSHTPFGKTMAAASRIVRALDAALRQAGLEYQFDRGRRRARPGAHLRRLGAAVLPAAAFRARLRARCRAGRSRACSSSRRCRAIIATLLRGTVEGFLPNHDVYITEWVDARMVPVSEGASISTTTSTT